MGRTGVQYRSRAFHSYRFVIRRHPSVFRGVDMDFPAEVRITVKFFVAIDVGRMGDPWIPTEQKYFKIRS